MDCKVIWKRSGHKIELVGGIKIINLVKVEMIRKQNRLHVSLLITPNFSLLGPL